MNVKFNFFTSKLVTCGIKQKLLEVGSHTLATIPKNLRNSPSYDSNNKIDIKELVQILQGYGISLTKEEINALLNFLDKTNERRINVDDFLISVRGKPNDERQSCIDFVFNKFDKSRVGFAETTELRKVFNCVKHPRFLTGELNEDQIFYLYLRNYFEEIRAAISKKVNLIVLIFLGMG